MRVAIAIAVLLAGCNVAPPPRDRADKEIYVEAPPERAPCKECGRPFDDPTADPHFAQSGIRFKFPLDAVELDRCFAIARALNPGADQRLKNLALLVAASEEQVVEGETKGQKMTGEHKQGDHERPPALLWLPDRPDLRNESACYVGHAAFLEGARVFDIAPIHHLRVLIANREPCKVELDLTTFHVSRDPSDASVDALPLLAAANDHGASITRIEVAPGTDGIVHLFFRDSQGLSAFLRCGWTVRFVSVDGAVEERRYDGSLVRRYVATDAPFTPLEDRVARGLPLAELGVERGPWVDPMLEAIGGGR